MSVATSPWLPAIALVFLACGARFLCKSWLAPAAFVALLWSVAACSTLLMTDYEINASALWIIVLFIFILQLGTFIGESLSEDRSADRLRNKKQPGDIFANAKTLQFCILFAVIAFAGSVYFIFWSFWRWDLQVSPISFLALGHIWSARRYMYGEIEPWPVRLSVMWVYPAALLGGISFARDTSRKNRLWSLSPLLPALLVGTIVAARAGVLISVVCWISGYLAVKHWQSGGRYAIFRPRFFLGLIGLSVAALLVFICLDAVRMFNTGSHDFAMTLDLPRLVKYGFGFLPAFSNWFHQYRPASPMLGACTFGGIFDLLGIQHREVGLYNELTTLTGGEDTNIYTAFRGLIQDFTLLGTIFILFIFGLIAGALVSNPWRKPWRGILSASGYYTFVLWSPIVSISLYNGLILAWLVGLIVLRSDFRARRPHLFIGRIAATEV